jgi:hypothetical protein
MAGRYHAALLLAGLVALGLESTIFFFSRIALFETPHAYSDAKRTLIPIQAGH